MASGRGAAYRVRVHPYFAVATPHLFAHRGASGHAPENTLVAFERAWATGVPYLEMDCHATCDGEVVIAHDPLLERTTDGEGPIRQVPYARLRELDAGYRFSPDGGRSTPFRGQGVRMPRLVEVLETFPQARVNLEIKQAEPAIAAEVVRIVRRARAQDRVLLAAEDDTLLDTIRALDAGTALGSSLADCTAFFRALDAGSIAAHEPRGQALQIPAAVLGRALVTPESVAAAGRLGLHIHVWTINDPAEMRSLLALGAHGLMSDYPERLQAAARERAAAR